MTEQKHDDARGASLSDAVLEAKPCPFCGSENLAISYDGQPAVLGYIACADCKASGPKVHVQGNSGWSEAALKWQARASNA